MISLMIIDQVRSYLIGISTKTYADHVLGSIGTAYRLRNRKHNQEPVYMVKSIEIAKMMPTPDFRQLECEVTQVWMEPKDLEETIFNLSC